MEDRVQEIERRLDADASQRELRQQVLDSEIGGLRSSIEELRKEIMAQMEKLRNTIFGNGKLEGSLCWELQTCKARLQALEDKVSRIMGTDDWRKAFIAGAIRSVATGVLAAVFLKLFGAVK